MRHGKDERLLRVPHIFANVYPEMLLQITRDYPGLPDARTLRAREIVFFYNGLRAELKAHSKSKG